MLTRVSLVLRNGEWRDVNVIIGKSTFKIGGEHLVTLRHGNACLVENNCFLGEGAKGTGGIRVIGEDHVVRGNYLERLTGDDARSGITLMMGIPNSPAERYFQVQRATIDTTFARNMVSCPKYSVIETRCDLEGMTWTDNRFLGKSLGMKDIPPGITVLAGGRASELGITPLKAISRKEVGTAW